MITLVNTPISNEYRKKWNIHPRLDDFVTIHKDDKQISPQLYRVGGFRLDLNKPYFMLIKQVESYYDYSITNSKSKARNRHLAGHWCIINQNGVEKQVFSQFTNVYIVAGIVYSIDNNYYNIETGEYYGHSSNHMKSSDFLFINNEYSFDCYNKNYKDQSIDPKERLGVYKINIHDGSYEIFK